jgi:hypothetical protein
MVHICARTLSVEGEGQVVVARLLDGAVVHHARAVEEHVQGGELRDQRADGGLVEHVELQRP